MVDSKLPFPPATRKSNAVFGIGAGITDDDAEITGSRLPTSAQVLRCYLFHRLQGLSTNRTKRDNAKIVLQKIVPFYEKANIPMITQKKCCEKIIKLCEKNAKLREIAIDRRSSASTQCQLKEAETELGKTFPLWSNDAESIMKNDEDIEFLKSMKCDRIASFGSHDKKLESQLKRKAARLKKEEERRDKAKHCRQELCSSAAQFTSTEEECSSENDDDSCFVYAKHKIAKSHRRSIHTGTSAFVPHDILKRPKVVSVATRMKLTPAQQAAITRAIIDESEGNSSKVSSSYATADRSRRTVNKKTAIGLKQSWVSPQFASIHWDSKLMQSQTKHMLEERLVVAVGDRANVKVLGVPTYLPGTNRRTGDIIAEASIKLLDSWNCKDSIINMTFDTTASNTGHVSAACITLQQGLGRALLWSACRHHVGEVILTQVFNDLKIEASKSAEYTIFSRFRKHFDLVPHGDDECLSPFDKNLYSGDEQMLSMITEWQKKTIDLANTVVQHQREDYKEFTELCLLYLDTVDSNCRSCTFRRPGACHKARWMAKILYAVKMVLLEQQISSLPNVTITTLVQQEKLRSFVTFVCLIYSRWWLTCTSAVDAPWHDLCLYHNLQQYTAVHCDISASALTALNRHLWYLCSEMVPLALFSDIVPKVELQYLADRLLAVCPTDEITVPQDRYGTGFGKPQFPKNITVSTRLGDLVTANSWFIFRILAMDTAFLSEDVNNWPGQQSFLSSKAKTAAVNVVNDSAERGVKLSSDYLDAARSEEHYQNVLQVVESDRQLTPNLRRPRKKI